MSVVHIGATASRALADADDQWVHQQLNGRREGGSEPCVRILIDEGGAKLQLGTAACSSGGGGFRRPNAKEEEIFDLWKARGMDARDFKAGHLSAFLHQLRKLLRS